MKDYNTISDELLIAYIEGNLSEDDALNVEKAIDKDNQVFSRYAILNKSYKDLEETKYEVTPDSLKEKLNIEFGLEKIHATPDKPETDGLSVSISSLIGKFFQPTPLFATILSVLVIMLFISKQTENADGSETMFDPNSEIFHVDDDEYNYLDFQLIINDKNGLDDIRYVRYQINIEKMTAEDSCNYEPESGFLNYPQWFLEYKETTDAGFVFDVNNAYLAEPGIPIKPLNQCGRTGVSTFRFIIADMIFDPIVEDRFVGFDK